MILGHDGPSVVVPCGVANVIAPPLKRWYLDALTRLPRDQRERLRPIGAVIEELERVALGPSLSADVSASGQFHRDIDECAQDPPVHEWVTVQAAADMLNLDQRTVRRLTTAGALRCWQPARDRLVSVNSIRSYLEVTS